MIDVIKVLLTIVVFTIGCGLYNVQKNLPNDIDAAIQQHEDKINSRNCDKYLAPAKTFEYYQEQFKLVANNQNLSCPRNEDYDKISWGAYPFDDTYNRMPIGAYSVRFKVVNGKVVDQQVKDRDYGWCNYDKHCITSDQIRTYASCTEDMRMLPDPGQRAEEIILTSKKFLDGEHIVWFQIGTDNYLKNTN